MSEYIKGIDGPEYFEDADAKELARLLAMRCLEATIEDGHIVIKAILDGQVVPVAKIDFLEMVRNTSEEIRHIYSLDDLLEFSGLIHQAAMILQRDIVHNENPGSYSTAMLEPTDDLDFLYDDTQSDTNEVEG